MPRRWWRIVVALAIAFAAGFVWMSRSPSVITGDEPHYVVIADSIVAHHTLDLRASYADRNGVSKFVPGIRPHVVTKPDGRMLPWPQGLGLPVLIAPAWWLRHSFRAVRIELIAIGALLCLQLLLLIEEIRPRWRGATAIWLATIASLPVVAYMSQIYPDIPAALLVAIALRMLVRLRRNAGGTARDATVALLVLSACCGLMPWFHIRYVVVAFGLALAGVLVARRARELPWPVVVAGMLPFAAGFGLLCALYLWMYGTLRPSTFSHFVTHGKAYLSAVTSYRYGLGSFLGATRGLVTFAPVYLVLAAAALATLWLRRRDPATLVLGVTVMVYVFVVLPYATYGVDFPARYTVALIPIVVAAAAYVLPFVAAVVVPTIALGGLSIVVAFAAAPHSEQMLIKPASIPIVRSYDRLFPRIELLRGIDAVAHAPASAASAPSAPSRVVAPWPADQLRRARYVAGTTVRLATSGRTQSVVVEAIDDHGPFSHTSVSASAAKSLVTLRFTTRDDEPVVRIVLIPQSTTARIVAGELHVQRVGPALDRSAPTRHDIPKAVVWCAILLAAAALIARTRATPRPLSSAGR